MAQIIAREAFENNAEAVYRALVKALLNGHGSQGSFTYAFGPTLKMCAVTAWQGHSIGLFEKSPT
jgi:hypothetical protein